MFKIVHKEGDRRDERERERERDEMCQRRVIGNEENE